MRLRFVVAAVVIGVSVAAHADTFSLSSILQQGTLTGTITINTQAGTVTDSNLLFTLGNYQTILTGAASLSHPTSPNLSVTQINDVNTAGEYVGLLLPSANLIAY